MLAQSLRVSVIGRNSRIGLNTTGTAPGQAAPNHFRSHGRSKTRRPSPCAFAQPVAVAQIPGLAMTDRLGLAIQKGAIGREIGELRPLESSIGCFAAGTLLPNPNTIGIIALGANVSRGARFR
jgi:hypothetical protein